MEDYVEIKSIKRNHFIWIFSIITTVMLSLVLLIGITQSVLSSSKTATGVISIIMPPSSGVGSEHLFYDSANSSMRAGKDTNGQPIAYGSSNMAKVVLVDTQSANSAYVKIEMKVLGSTTALSYNTSGQVPTFSDSTTLTSSLSNGVLTLTSSKAIAQYSYMFLDSVLANLSVNGSLLNGTLQVKASVSLESDFKNSSSNLVYYNLSSTCIVLPSSTNYTATSLTQAPEIGKPYVFKVTLAQAYNRTAPVVKVNGVALSPTSGSSGVYTYTIASMAGGENITITPTLNKYTVNVRPTGDSPNTNVATITLSHGDKIITTNGTDLYYKSGVSSQQVLYTGSQSNSNKKYTVTSYLMGGNPMAMPGEFEVTQDIEIQAYWESETISTCVKGDTKIATGFNGEYKLAKDVKVGDYVLGMDMKTGELILSQVTNTFIRQKDIIYKVTFSDGTELQLTGNHPMLTKRGWVCTNYDEFVYDPHIMGGDTVEKDSLQVGDYVKTYEGYKRVVEIESSVNTESVYDFTVVNLGNFFAEGTLLHNTKSPT